MRGIWRREDLKEITMRHFPEKQMVLHNFYKNLLQHSTIFFVKSFQQVWMKQKQDFSERKAWKKCFFFGRKLYNICLPTLFSILKSRKTQIIAKNTCEFLVWYLLLVSCLYMFFFVKKIGTIFNVSFSTKIFRISLFFRQISRVIVVAIMVCPVSIFSWDP